MTDRTCLIVIEVFSRVKVFDYALYVDDRVTPLSYTMRWATVVCRYGKLKKVYLSGDLVLGPYEDCVDVIFDHRPERVSRGHFTHCIEEG